MISHRKTLATAIALLTLIGSVGPSLARGGTGMGRTGMGTGTGIGTGTGVSRAPQPYIYQSPTTTYTPPSYTYTPRGGPVATPPAP